MDGAHEASTIGSWPAGSIANSPPPFLNKTYDMVDDPATDLVVSWSNGNNSFVVWSVPEFERDLLPKYFKHNNFASFIRQLNTYGFKKVDPDRWEFANEGFLRGQKHLLKSISRRKAANAHGHEQPPPVQGTSVGSCVEVGKLGIEEDVEWLKRDKNVLMQELVRLRQQQQATDHQLQTAGQRIQVMEQRQQQMMSFLAKAMQSPGFLAQLVQQQNENKRQISGVNKKRRLPKQEEEISVSNHVNASPDGQMVKYQPQLNEAAKAMLRQILKMNAPVRLEPNGKNSNGYLIDDVHSHSKGWDGDGFSCGISEMLPASAESYFSAESNFPSSCPSAAFSEIHSSADVVSDPGKVAQFPEMNVLNSPEGSISPQFSQIQGIIPGSSVEVTEEIFAGHETHNSGYIDNTLDLKNGAMPIVGDEFFPDPDGDIMLDDIPKLPGINDVFWEQFLSASPLSGDSDEITSEAREGGIRNEQEVEVNGWEKIQHMNHLTEQMGLLASEARRR